MLVTGVTGLSSVIVTSVSALRLAQICHSGILRTFHIYNVQNSASQHAPHVWPYPSHLPVNTLDVSSYLSSIAYSDDNFCPRLPTPPSATGQSAVALPLQDFFLLGEVHTELVSGDSLIQAEN